MSLISSTIFFVQLMMQSTDTEGKGKKRTRAGPFMVISITPANIVNSTAANWTTFRTAENAIQVSCRVTSIDIDINTAQNIVISGQMLPIPIVKNPEKQKP
jgi:hypothetical protein